MSIDIEKIKQRKGRRYIFDKEDDIVISVNDYLEYKEIEKKLGIDLATFVRIIKEFISTKENDDISIYFKYFDGTIELINVVCPRIDLENKRIIDLYNADAIDNEPYYYYFSEYGINWALTKEELL